VGDQGSADGTRAIIHKIASEYKGPHKLRVFDCPDTEYRGFIGCNRHMKFLMDRVEGEVAFPQSADDWSMPNRVETQMEVFERTGAAMVTGKMQYEENGSIVGSTTHDTEGWLTMKQVVVERAGSSGCSDWRTDFWHNATPIPELIGSDVWLPPIAVVLGGIYFSKTPVYTYTQTADSGNTGLNGVIRNLAGDDKLPVVEAAQYQLAYAQQELMTWFSKKGLGSQEDLQILYEEMMYKLIAMFELRKQMTYKKLEPYRIAA
jgi:hypothetical protein